MFPSWSESWSSLPAPKSPSNPIVCDSSTTGAIPGIGAMSMNGGGTGSSTGARTAASSIERATVLPNSSS